MTPDNKFIKIHTSKKLISEFLTDLIISPRQITHKWAELTKQSPALKIGYIGQYLASLVLGMYGGRSAARGKDIEDGTEVKTCNKIDQTDACNDCNARVMRTEVACPKCGSTNIERKDDTKWLFSIRSKAELDNLLHLDRILLTVFDYPMFSENDFSSIRVESFEIYPISPRMSHFSDMCRRHYAESYLPKIKKTGKANPMNLHPYNLDFYLCNPINVFSAIISHIDTANPEINIQTLINPSFCRDQIQSVNMPIALLRNSEKRELYKRHPELSSATELTEAQRKWITPRKYKTHEQSVKYTAR